MQSKRGKTIGLFILEGLSGGFFGLLIQEFWKFFYDPNSLSNIPFGYLKAIIGIIAFAGAIITAVFLIQHLHNNRKKKQNEENPKKKPPNDDDDGGYIAGIENKRGYKSKLRDELWDIDDQPQ